MIRAIIYDLDNTLFPTNTIKPVLYPFFDALKQANHTLSDKILQRSFDALWKNPFHIVAREYAFSKEMIAAGEAVLAGLSLDFKIKPYPDVYVIDKLPVDNFLVTSGFTKIQNAKIDNLDLRAIFKEIFIDDPSVNEKPGKRPIFKDIMLVNDLQPDQVLVVGDNPVSEIRAGNGLGIITIQILRNGVEKSKEANYYINSLQELKAFL